MVIGLQCVVLLYEEAALQHGRLLNADSLFLSGRQWPQWTAVCNATLDDHDYTIGVLPYSPQNGTLMPGWANMRTDLAVNGNWTPEAARAYIAENAGTFDCT